MKKILILFATIIMVALFAMSVSAKEVIDSGECGAQGDSVTWVFYDDGELVISGEGKIKDYTERMYASEVELPRWDIYNEDIHSIVVENGITTIGKYAFEEYENLKSIVLSDSVKTINQGAFSSNYKLTNISFGGGVEKIGEYAFAYCTNLDSIIFPDTLLEIDNYSFCGCRNLNDFSIPDSVVKLGESIFEETNFYNKISNWSDGILYYEKFLLDAKDDISGKVIIKDDVKVIANSSFFETDVTEIIMPDSVNYLGDSVFSQCYNLNKIQLSDNLTELPDWSFNYCTNLEDVNIPRKIERIGLWAFSNCEKLKQLTLPVSLKEIAYGAFDECNNLTDIYYQGSVDSWFEMDNSAYTDNLIIHCEDDDIVYGDIPDNNDTGDGTFVSGDYTYVIDDGVAVIIDIKNAYGDVVIPEYLDGYAVVALDSMICYDNNYITSVVLPDGITSIGSDAFLGCENLKKVVLPNSLIKIGDSAFGGSGLTEINIPQNVYSIGSFAFSSCNKLNYVEIPGNVKEIEQAAFGWCENLKEVKLNEGVEHISVNAFYGCYNLESFYMPDSILTIEHWVFGETKLRDECFLNNDGIHIIDNHLISFESERNGSYKLSDNILTIADEGFKDCKLNEIALSKNLTRIGASAFYSCTELETIAIYDNLDYIAEGAFRYNDKLKDIYYYGTEEQWNSIRIEGNNTALTEATIHFLGEDDIHTHLYTEVTIIEPTCTEIGTKTYTCTCGDTYTETIPATNHPNATTDAGKAPTTTEVGYTAGKYCPDCKTWLEGHEEIPMLHTHTYTSTITKEATCWREGEKTYTCTCGDSYTEAIAKLDHEYRPWETKRNPTCTAPGLEWSYCLLCDNDFEREIPATGHTIIDYTRRATPDSDGAYVTACDVCNEVFKSISFGRPTEYKLSTTRYTYDGKTKTPKLTVETSDGVVLKEGVDYELELPSGRKAVGVYTYRVVFKGNFLGEKKVSYQILPGKTSKITATQSTSAIKLTWKKVTGADGYRVYQYNSKTGKYEKIKTLTGTSYTVKKLKAGTTYKFAVKAYSKADGETLWAASSVSIKTATKPATPTVKATVNSNKVTLKWSKVTGATGYVIYMQDEFGDYNKIGSTKKTSYSVKNLEYGETCRFRVVAYKKVDGKNIYGGYKTVKITVPYPAIYVTPTGKRYHFDKECAGKNATKTTLANAQKTKTPCKTCVL